MRPARPLRLNGWRDWGMGLLASLLSLLAAIWVLDLWNATPGVPWFPHNDNKSFMLLFQNIQSTGWWTTSEVIGGGNTDISHFPLGGGALAHYLGVWLLGLVVRDPISLYNAYFLLSVPLAALTGYYAFRRLAIQPAFAVALGTLYTLLPYHFNRGHRGHIFLAAYAAVPLAAMLVTRHAAGEPILVRGSATAAIQQDRRARLVETAAIAVLIGASTMYYALMFVLLLLIVSLIRSIRDRSDIVFTSAFRTVAISGLALIVGLLPTLLTWLSTGLPAAVGRNYASSEVYSFKIVSAILPVEGHRIPAFADLRERLSGSPIPGEGPESLGLIGAAGAALLLWWVLRRTTRGRKGGVPLGPLALSTSVAFLLATTGGFGAVLSTFGISFLRSWARMGIFISWFALAAVGLWLEARASRTAWSRRLTAVLATALIVIGVLDQTSPIMAPDHASLHVTHHDDTDYVRRLEQALGPEARVLQLPYMTFPENSEPVGIPAYDPLRWPLTGSSLRWSFGAPKDGRADWQRTVSRMDAEGVMIAAWATNYDAILIDRHGYEEGADALIEELERLVGPAIRSNFDRFVTFPLSRVPVASQSVRDDLEVLVRNATVVRSGAGFESTTRTAGQPLMANHEPATLTVNPGPDLEESLPIEVRPLSGPIRLTITSSAGRQVVTVREPRSIALELPTDRSATFEITIVAEPLSDYGAARVRWELVDIDLPLDDAIRHAVS